MVLSRLVPKLRSLPLGSVLPLGVLLTAGCGLVDSGEPSPRSEWCDHEGVGDIAAVTVEEDRNGEEWETTSVVFLDADRRKLATVYEPDEPSLRLEFVYTYDASGNVIRIVEEGRNGARLTVSEYDDEGRSTLTSIDQGSDGSIDQLTTWDYSVEDEVTIRRDEGADGSVDWIMIATTYEDGARIRRTTDSDGDGLPETFEMSYYDEDGRPLESFWSGASGTSASVYEYDDEGQMLSHTYTSFDLEGAVQSEVVEEYDLNAAGLRTKVTRYATVGPEADQVIVLTYDEEGRLIRTVTTEPDLGDSIQAFEYEDGDDPVRISLDWNGNGTWDTVTTTTACN